MIFAKLDVCFDNHPKFLRLALSGDEGKIACAYWAAVLTFLRRNDSPDGTVADTDIGMPLQFGDGLARKLCERLVDAGLFERREGGYLLLRYAEKNETREQIEERRAANRDRVAKHRAKRAGRKKARSSAHVDGPPITPASVTYYGENYKPTEVTRESRVAAGSGSDSGSDETKSPRSRGTRIPPDFSPSEATQTWCQKAGTPPGAHLDAFRDFWAAHSGPTSVKRDWDAAFRTWVRRAREEKPSGVRPRPARYSRATAPSGPRS